MERSFAVILFAGAALAPMTFGNAWAQERPGFALNSENASGNLSTSSNLTGLPPVPGGESTVLGGEIRRVDPVQDQFQLQVFGERPMRILFDERTQVYRDGKRISLRELGPEEHASVQTVLDGASVFAISIHILSRSPEGETEGRVLTYNPATGELTIRSMLSPTAIKFLVTKSTSVARKGQPSFVSAGSGQSDLEPGSLISIKFEAGNGGRSVADQIAVLAVPGYAFVFAGNISSLDLGSGYLVIVDAQDNQSYEIHFDPPVIAASRNLHPGERISVTAGFDGTQYVANRITLD
ncbi:MAG: hypothetical protein WB608_06890 [Terracidiphilus sp.]